MSVFADLFETRYLGERVAMAIRQTPIAVIASVVACLCVVLVYWSEPARAVILPWAAVVMINNAVRLWAYRHVSRPEAKSLSASAGLRSIVASSVVGGLVWGAAPILVYDGALTPPFLFLAFVIGGLSAGASGVFATVPAAPVSWFACAVLPTAFLLLINVPANPVAVPAAVMLLVYVALLSAAGLFQYRAILEGLQLRDKNQALSAESLQVVADQADWVEELAVINRRLGSESRARVEAQKGLEEAQKKILLSAQAVSQCHGLKRRLDQAVATLSNLEGQLEPSDRATARDEILALRRLLLDASANAQTLLDTNEAKVPGDCPDKDGCSTEDGCSNDESGGRKAT